MTPTGRRARYLAWRDPVSGLGGNHRIGNELNRGVANLWCGVYHERGTRFRCNGEALPLVRLDEEGMCAGPQRLFLEGARLRFVLDGEGCRAELEITDVGSRSFANAQTFTGTAGTAGTIFSNNFHVFCRVRGTVELDGTKAEVDAPAWRDHSWGARRWDSFVSSRSFGGTHGEATSSSASRPWSASTAASSGSARSPVAGSRSRSPAPRCWCTSTTTPCAAPPPRSATGSKRAGRRVVRIETIGGMIGATSQRYGWESVGDVRVDGEPGGWGFLETNLNARNGQSPPAFVLADALTNGVTRPPPVP